MRQDDLSPSLNIDFPGYDVVIPCFDRAGTVERAVVSVLAQARRPTRIILVDDGSTDRSAHVLAELEERHESVQVLFLPRNAGASAARNAGLALARAEWIAFLDSDDAWLPGAAEALLARTGDSDVVVGHFRRAWRSGLLDAAECGWDGGNITAALALTGAIGPSWSLVRRATAMAVGGFDPSYHNCNDWDFYVRIAAVDARFVRTDAVIAHYHIAEDNRLSLDQTTAHANARRVLAHPSLTEWRTA